MLTSDIASEIQGNSNQDGSIWVRPFFRAFDPSES